jgi:4-carboxymuconolactone decarboxylase
MATLPMAPEKLREINPKLMDLTAEVLFGDVWERSELSKRDRSLITVAALVATYRPIQLAFHMERALANGVTKAELLELITHLAFYTGWPSSIAATEIAGDVFGGNKSP